MNRKLAGLCMAALLVGFAFGLAPDASAQFGTLDCRACTRICWEGMWLFESCEYFCVSEGHAIGYSECYAGSDWCQQIDRCVLYYA